jgi:hypothetical protein
MYWLLCLSPAAPGSGSSENYLESPGCYRVVHEAEAEQRKTPEVPYKKMAGEISKVIHHNRRCSVKEIER